jgi:hypothetical protein
VQRDTTAARAVFRNANEEIFAFAAELLEGEHGTLVPFLCECPERSCTGIVRLSLSEFEQARAGAGHFVVLPRHERTRAEERVVERGERFSLVRESGAETAS